MSRAVLDIAIVNVALPAIQRDLGLRQNTLQWVVIAYGLLLGGFLLLGGRLGDLLGRRRIFLAGLAVFSIASLVAGLAQSAEVLIGALSGVSGPAVGLASGLVETLREIGGAVGIAAVATVLVSRTERATPNAAFEGFQAAFVVIVVLAALGALLALIAFPRAARGAEALVGEERGVLAGATSAD